MRPHTPPVHRRPRTLTGALGPAAVLAAVLPVLLAAVGPVACAVKGGAANGPGAARRNRMEAPPPFPSAPDFTVADSTGAERSLDALMGRKGLVLVLYRGHW